ncbi:MAG: hypothetical protein HZB20_06705 [Chloroflexi bacterium]|nr:hypothetical protein [Chloroflexota bacterium]
MATTMMTEEKPNGPVAAAFLAGGIGCAAMGLITTASAASAGFANSLKWVGPAGPLSGKTTLAVIIFFVSWAVLHFIFRGKETNFSRITTIALVLVVIGLLGTFPPFFDLFAPQG